MVFVLPKHVFVFELLVAVMAVSADALLEQQVCLREQGVASSSSAFGGFEREGLRTWQIVTLFAAGQLAGALIRLHGLRTRRRLGPDFTPCLKARSCGLFHPQFPRQGTRAAHEITYSGHRG